MDEVARGGWPRRAARQPRQGCRAVPLVAEGGSAAPQLQLRVNSQAVPVSAPTTLTETVLLLPE